VATIPFNSKRKKATCALIENVGGQKIIRVYVKGAPEFVIGLCNQYLLENGQISNLSEEKKEQILSGVI
jgi:magnesium-transporting ATPase (P-type)